MQMMHILADGLMASAHTLQVRQMVYTAAQAHQLQQTHAMAYGRADGFHIDIQRVAPFLVKIRRKHK